METTFAVLIAVALAATLGVLGFGLVVMFRGGEFNRRHGNRLMRMRVIFQGLTILLIVIAFLALRQ